MADRFDELGAKVRAECESYALRASLDGRARVIADALREAHASGRRAALTEARALVPNEAEREALAKLRELRSGAGGTLLRQHVRDDLLPDYDAGTRGARALRALLALLAPEGEVSRG